MRAGCIAVNALCVLASLGLVRSAHASHPPDRSEFQQIVIDQAQGRAVALGLRFGGYLLSGDGGASWSSVCPAALGYDDSETYPGAGLDDGSLIVALGHAGIARSRDGGCGWSAWHPDFSAFFLDLDAADAARLVALSSTLQGSGWANQLWLSLDRGASWQAHGARLPADLAATSFASSPGNASRWYVAGSGPAGAELLRSDDAGASFRRFTIDHGGVARLAAASATLPDAVAVILDGHRHDAPGSSLTDQLLLSRDGGAHFDSLYTASADLTAAAWSDGGELAFGGPEDGLWVATLERSAQLTQRALPPGTALQALAWAGARLYAGVAAPSGELALVVAEAGEAGFSPVFSLCKDLAPLACPSDSAVGAICSGESAAQVSLTSAAQPWCNTPAPAAPSDGGSTAEASSCSAARSRARAGAEWGVLLAAIVLACASLRRRAS